MAVFTLKGSVSGTEVRFTKDGDEYGYARFNDVDRKSGRVTQRTLLVFGKAYKALSQSWYDGLRGAFTVTRRGGTLYAIAYVEA